MAAYESSWYLVVTVPALTRVRVKRRKQTMVVRREASIVGGR
jgi:hypothetical protein